MPNPPKKIIPNSNNCASLNEIKHRQNCHLIRTGAFTSAMVHLVSRTTNKIKISGKGITNIESEYFHQGQSDHFEPPGTDSEISQPFNRPSSPNVNRCSRTETAAFDIVIPIM